MTRAYLSVVSGLALGVLAVATVTSAQPQKTYRHGAKAHQGFRSGLITNGERRIIAKNRRRVIRLRQGVFQDDYVTRREARKLKKAKRRLHNSVYWAKNNDWVRKHPRDHQRWRFDEHDHAWRRTGRYPSWLAY